MCACHSFTFQGQQAGDMRDFPQILPTSSWGIQRLQQALPSPPAFPQLPVQPWSLALPTGTVALGDAGRAQC